MVRNFAPRTKNNVQIRMKKFGATLFTVLLSATVVAEQLPSASFSYFKYEGKDKRFNRQIDQMHQYMNPVISGFIPILRFAA